MLVVVCVWKLSFLVLAKNYSNIYVLHVLGYERLESQNEWTAARLLFGGKLWFLSCRV
jgi:hypothetical protein